MLNMDMDMKAVDFKRPGGPHVLQVTETEMPFLDKTDIMIKVVATGLNSHDALIRRESIIVARMYREVNLGDECSGIVVAVGSGVSDFKEGDEVCAILRTGGAYAEFVAVPTRQAVKIPSGVSLLIAATLPLASCLSFYALSRLAKVTPGKRILIHGAANGIGVIALQYAKHLGCQVFAGAETEEQLRLCKMLGADACFNHKKEDFCKRVIAETNEKGVDIILDICESDYFQKDLNCLAIGGSLILLGLKGCKVDLDIDMSVLGMKDINVIGMDLFDNRIFSNLKLLLSGAVGIFWPLIEAGHIRPIIGKVFSFSEAVEAHRALEERIIGGKLLLVPTEMPPPAYGVAEECSVVDKLLPVPSETPPEQVQAWSDDFCSSVVFLITKYIKFFC